MPTAFITHSDCLKHDMGRGHPEQPARLTAIEDQLIASGLEAHLKRYDAPLATDEQVALAHPMLGEEPGAVVQLKPAAQADEAALKAFVATRLAAFKVPVKIRIGTELLPRNANGKIIKAELKKLLAS